MNSAGYLTRAKKDFRNIRWTRLMFDIIGIISFMLLFPVVGWQGVVGIILYNIATFGLHYESYHRGDRRWD